MPRSVSWLMPAPVRRIVLWPTAVGNRYLCPNCGRAARRFRAAGRPGRPLAQCPWFGSLERHRILWRYIEALPAPTTVLHIAPERQLSHQLEGIAAEYVSVDIAKGSAAVQADITLPLPFPRGYFDLIVCSQVLEHIPDDVAAVKQLANVLALSGQLLVMVPVFDSERTVEEVIDDPTERSRVYGQSDHVRAYGRDVLDRLRAGGLQWSRSTGPTIPQPIESGFG